MCEHTPVSAEDCKPNNKLRMTTRAFLKTAEKKRDSSQAKEATPITPITPIDANASAALPPPPPEKAVPAEESSATDAAPATEAAFSVPEAERGAGETGASGDHEAASAAAEIQGEEVPAATENEVCFTHNCDYK